MLEQFFSQLRTAVANADPCDDAATEMAYSAASDDENTANDDDAADAACETVESEEAQS